MKQSPAMFQVAQRTPDELDWTLYQADALQAAQRLPDNSVHLIVTSVPYYLLRSYSCEGQYGLEDSVEIWAANQVAVFRELRRVLHPSGSVYLNCGDCYYSSRSFAGAGKNTDGVFGRVHDRMGSVVGKRLPKHPVLKPKDLVMQADRLAIELQKDGWWVRSKVIWYKPNGTPQSPPDRPPIDYEHVHILTKVPKGYFYNRYAVWVPPPTPPSSKTFDRLLKGLAARGTKSATLAGRIRSAVMKLVGFNKSLKGHFLRAVWTIPSVRAYVDAHGRKHHATFPKELVMPCVKAGSSERACPKCLEQWRPVVSKAKGGAIGKAWHDHDGDLEKGNAKKTSSEGYEPPKVVGWKPGCECRTEKGGIPKGIPATVMDIYTGTSTTGVVALELGRNFIGVDISEEYLKISIERLEKEFPRVWGYVKRFLPRKKEADK